MSTALVHVQLLVHMLHVVQCHDRCMVLGSGDCTALKLVGAAGMCLHDCVPVIDHTDAYQNTGESLPRLQLRTLVVQGLMKLLTM